MTVSSEFVSVESEPATLHVDPVEYLPGPGVVTNADEASLEAALGAGVPVTFGVNGVILFTNPIPIATNTTIDGTARRVILDGNNLTRHFIVTNGARLHLINLTLRNGRALGLDGTEGVFPQPVGGGSILSSGGELDLIGCTFMSNQVVGGMGGPDSFVAQRDDVCRGGPSYGGAVYSENGLVAMANCVLAGNQALGGNGHITGAGYVGGGGDALGGAVYCTNGTCQLSGVVFSNNVAKGGNISEGRPEQGGGNAYGGALADEREDLSISGCEFVGNQTFGLWRSAWYDRKAETGMARGGALYHGSGSGAISKTLFALNTATGGTGYTRSDGPFWFGEATGGAILNLGELSIESSAIVSNNATGRDTSHCCDLVLGGGYLFQGLAGSVAGGGIANEGSLSLVNCTLAQNVAHGGGAAGGRSFPGSAFGAALFLTNGVASLLNVTVADNRLEVASNPDAGPPPAMAEGLGQALGSSICVTNSMVAVTNTILSCLAGQTNVSGTLSDGGHNLCSDASAGFTASGSVNAIDPALGPLADNGGPTPTLALLPNSPAVDAGGDQAAPPTDQRGVARPQGSGSDMGAFELVPHLALEWDPRGPIALLYSFRAGETNRVFRSTDLLQWYLIGTVLSDAQGSFRIEDSGGGQPQCFYLVEPFIEEP